MTRCPRCQRRLPPKGSCPMHGRPSVVATITTEVPSVVAPEGWTLGREIAAGGSSLVYSITDASGRPAVLKRGRWSERDIHDRFAHEAEILRVLGPPLTPAYIAHGATEGWPYLVMEEVTGETLAAAMARWGSTGALGELVAALIRVAGALQALHEAGYLHRDLKPENIVLGPREVRLLDFGLAVLERDSVAHGVTAAGTVHYLAPEQLRSGAVVDRRSDIYSLGVIAHEMIAGQPPFVGERKAIEYQHSVSRPPSLRETRELPSELEDIIVACLAKQPEARPQTAAVLAEQLVAVTPLIETLKGVGTSPKKLLGARERVVLLWVEGGDVMTVTRTIGDAHGIVVRSRAAGFLAAFAAQFHDAPLAVALATARDLARRGCRVVVHAASALLRRSAQGKPSFYGPDIEQPATWTPARAYSGLVLTRAAAELAATHPTPASDVAGFFRDPEAMRDRVPITRRDPPLVGRERIVQEITAIANAGGVLTALAGAQGSGKSRVLAAVTDRLRAAHRDVIAIRGRRRLVGDHADDERLLDALGGSNDLAQALADAGTRRAIVIVDDVQWFSPAAREQLLRDDLAVSRVLASRDPLFEVAPGVTRRLAIELQGLSFTEAEVLLRDLLQPAKLIPDVLLQRLAIRAHGIPGLLVALARDIKHRGGIRRHAGSDEWYVAADEIDTLLASPSDAWLAARGLEALPDDQVPLVRVAAALGPSFQAAELAAVSELAGIAPQLQALVHAGVFTERNGWFEFSDASLQDAIIAHALEDPARLHRAAQQYWVSNRTPNIVGRLARIAYHASNGGDGPTAAACFTALAREARKNGEPARADELEQRALACLVDHAPSAVIDAIESFED